MTILSMKKPKINLLVKIVIAIALGIVCGLFFPAWLSKVFVTFNSLFGNFLNFIVPLIILGLVVSGIADVGIGAGKYVLITVAIAYAFTLFSGFFTYGICSGVYPWLLRGDSLADAATAAEGLKPYFTIDLPPIMGVMSALVLAFVLGICLTMIKDSRFKEVADEFRDMIVMVITKVIIPILPLYIFGIFLSMTVSGQVFGVLEVFLKLIALIFLMTVVLLLIQFSIAGIVGRKNPLKMLWTMLTAYVTALGTQSSAATIPVTLAQVKKLGVRENVAGFTVPLCATIHLSGSTMKITACALAIMMLSGMPIEPLPFAGFIFMLGITMVAAPGVPGGCIMAAIGILQSMLGFDEMQIALMIALYIAMDSFGTATNVTGDGAVAVIMDKIVK